MIHEDEMKIWSYILLGLRRVLVAGVVHDCLQRIRHFGAGGGFDVGLRSFPEVLHLCPSIADLVNWWDTKNMK